jgi:hypothetical protein
MLPSPDLMSENARKMLEIDRKAIELVNLHVVTDNLLINFSAQRPY